MLYRLFSNTYYKIFNDHRYLYSVIKFPTYIYGSVRGKDKPVSINGWKMNIHWDDPGISAELALFKTHEPLSTQILSRLLSKGDYCLDIGANLGYYVLLTAGIVGETGNVIAVEPHPENFNVLQKNASINKLSNVEYRNIACSNYDGTAFMKTSKQSNWHMIASEKTVLENGESGFEVEARKVDTLAKSFTRLDFMRMDVEGHENEVIEGAHTTIETFQPALFMEFHPTLAGKDKVLELLAKLKNYDYEIKYFIPRFLDWPLIGKMSHVTKISIDEYITSIENADPIYGHEANVFLTT